MLAQWDPDGSLRTRLAAADPEISTYHAYAGRLIADYGLLLPVEPSSTLLSETELWQLAFSVVANYPGDLQTRKVPTGVTETVLKLYSDAAEHLCRTDDIADAAQEFYDLIDTLPEREGAERATVSQDAGISGRHRRAAGAAAIGRRTGRTDARTERPRLRLADVAGRATGRRAPEASPPSGRRCAQSCSTSTRTPGTAAGPVARVVRGSTRRRHRGRRSDPIDHHGWRGASAANLPRFATDFPRPDASPARRLELLTSWRNAAHALRLANAASDELVSPRVPVSVLRLRPDAPRHG